MRSNHLTETLTIDVIYIQHGAHGARIYGDSQFYLPK